MINKPHLFRRSNWLYTTDDGEYRAINTDGRWHLYQYRLTNEIEIAVANTYNELLPLFQEWWDSHGTDKREKEWGRF